MMNLAFKFRLYPNKKQREYFKDNFDACRFIKNQSENPSALDDGMNDVMS